MNEQVVKFIFSSGSMTFGPFDSYLVAAVEAANYARQVFETDVSIVRRWPRITIDEVRTLCNLPEL